MDVLRHTRRSEISTVGCLLPRYLDFQLVSCYFRFQPGWILPPFDSLRISYYFSPPLFSVLEVVARDVNAGSPWSRLQMQMAKLRLHFRKRASFLLHTTDFEALTDGIQRNLLNASSMGQHQAIITLGEHSTSVLCDSGFILRFEGVVACFHFARTYGRNKPRFRTQ